MKPAYKWIQEMKPNTDWVELIRLIQADALETGAKLTRCEHDEDGMLAEKLATYLRVGAAKGESPPI